MDDLIRSAVSRATATSLVSVDEMLNRDGLIIKQVSRLWFLCDQAPEQDLSDEMRSLLRSIASDIYKEVMIDPGSDTLQKHSNLASNIELAAERAATLVDQLRRQQVADLQDKLDATLAGLKDRYREHKQSDPAVRREVFNMNDGRCAYCDDDLGGIEGPTSKFVVEHVIPASTGGPDHLNNYVPACFSCNTKKSNGHVFQFIRRRLGQNVVRFNPNLDAAE